MRLTITASTLLALAPAAQAAPCFPDRPSVRLDQKLWHLQGGWDDDMKPVGPKGRWGTCTVDRGVVREADGRVVAHVFCGIDIRVRGIVDDLGLGVGVSGERVLEAYGDGPSSTLVCMHSFEPHVARVRCFIPLPPNSGSDRLWSYVVKGRLPATDSEHLSIVRGEAALAFFRRRTVVELQHRGSCH